MLELAEGALEIPDKILTYSVTAIEHFAFTGKDELVSVDIPDGVVSIGESAFENCINLESIKIPDSVRGIRKDAFKNTPWLESQSDGPIYMGTILYGWKGEMPENTELAVRAGTTGIASGAFSMKINLVSVTIPESLETIGSFAFAECKGLTTVTFSGTSRLKTIEGSAFSGCSKLVEIIIPDSVTHIRNQVFHDCWALKNVVIGSGVEEIGFTAFGGCGALESMTFRGSKAPEFELNDMMPAFPFGVFVIFSKVQGLEQVRTDMSKVTVKVPFAGLECTNEETRCCYTCERQLQYKENIVGN
jgi:hypothetical protein